MSSLDLSADPLQPPKKGAHVDPKALRDELHRLLSHPDLLPEEFKGWLVKYIDLNPPRVPSANIQGSVQRGSKGIDLAVDPGGAATQSIRWRLQSDGSAVAVMNAFGSLGESELQVLSTAQGDKNSFIVLETNAEAVTAATLQVLHYGTGSGGRINAVKATALQTPSGSGVYEKSILEGDGTSHFVMDYNNKNPYRNGSLTAASAYWYFTGIPADYSNRFYTASGNIYFDNGAYVTGTQMTASDGIMYCREDGVYHITMGVFDDHGGVAGNYAGARLVRNGTTRYILLGAHTAATADTDGFAGGHGSASLILQMSAGEYMRAECWSSAGYPLYVTQTWFRLPV